MDTHRYLGGALDRSVDNGKIRLAYILSASHSGSTLLAMLLGAHPDIATVGELKVTSLGDADQYRCSCLMRIKECMFWNAITQRMAKRGFSFDITKAGTDIRSGATPYGKRLLKPLHRGPALEALRDAALACSPRWRREWSRIQALNHALMASVLEETGRSVIVDSSKIGLRLKYLLRNPALDVRVVRLVRDGRGVALTYLDPGRFADASDPLRRGGGAGTLRAPTHRSMADAASEWRRSNEEAEAVLAQVSRSQWTEVRYERLCTEPTTTLASVFSFLGVQADVTISDFRARPHHVIGNGMRLDTMSEIRLDERWKAELSPSDLDVFQSVAGATNRRLGYA